MMKGLIDFLCKDSPQALLLREKYVFKIIPMLNPDGVIHGNYRCSLLGSDLNRRWKNPSKLLHPTIYGAKKLIKAFAKERELLLFVDLHGHSRRKNIFMYGNNNPACPQETRLFPFIMSKMLHSFSFQNSRFKMQRSKESTARIALFRELNCSNIYTMEASFCGATIGPLAGKHFTPQSYLEAGATLGNAILVYSDIDVISEIRELRAKNLQRSPPKRTKVFKEDNALLESPLTKTLERIHTPESTPIKVYIPTTPKKRKSVRRTNLSKKRKKQEKEEQPSPERAVPARRVDSEYEEELEWLQDLSCRQLLQELKHNEKLLHMGMGGGDSEGSSSGSDQNPSQDNLEPELMAKLLPSNIRNKYKSGGRRSNQRRKETIRAASQNQVSKKQPMRHSILSKDSQLKKKRAESTRRLASDSERPLSKMRVASRLYYQAGDAPSVGPARIKRSNQNMINRQLRRSLLASIDRRKFMIDFGTSDEENSQLSVIGRSAQRIALYEPNYNSLNSNIQTPSYYCSNGEIKRGPPIMPFYPRGGSSCQKKDSFRGSSKENRTDPPRGSISFFSSRSHLPVRSYCPPPSQTKHRHSNTDISSAREESKSEEKVSNLFSKINPDFLAPFHPLSENRRSSVTALGKSEMALPHIKDAIELNQQIKEIAAKNSKILERNAKVSAHCLMQYKMSQVGYAYNAILNRQSPSPVTLLQEKKTANYQSDLEMIQEQSGCKHSRTSSVANKQREEETAHHIRRMNSLRFKQPSETKSITSPRSNLVPRGQFLKAPRKTQKHRKATMSKDL